MSDNKAGASKTLRHVVIRQAVKSDCGELFRMIKELGKHLNLGDGRIVTEQVLESDGFGDRPLFQCLVAENPDYSEGCPRLIGYALYYFTYSTLDGRVLFLEDLYVEPQFRKLKIGFRLMKDVSQAGLDVGCSRISWNALGDSVSAINFYKRLGAEDVTDNGGWHVLKLNKSAMERLITLGFP